MKWDSTDQTGALGVAAAKTAFLKLGHIFREQPEHDRGIDAHVELVSNGEATGQLLALQIKSGESWMRERKEDHFVFRGNNDHLAYWLDHCLTVLVIVFDEENDGLFWQHVKHTNIERLEKGWKMAIPFSNQLVPSFQPTLEALGGLRASDSDYTVVRHHDSSHGAAKRYSINILLQGKPTRIRIEAVVRHVVESFRGSSWASSTLRQTLWSDKQADVISIFVALTMEDTVEPNWYCSAQWIDPQLEESLRPMQQEGDRLGKGLTVKWHALYEHLAQMRIDNTLSKSEWVQMAEGFVSECHQIMCAVFGQSMTLPTAGSSPDPLGKLATKMRNLSQSLNDPGIAPFECKEADRKLESLLCIADNCTMFYLPNEPSPWSAEEILRQQRLQLSDYVETLPRLRYELEKVLT